MTRFAVRSGKLVVLLALLVALLSWPAIYNGQPIFLEDTTAYIRGFDSAAAKLTGHDTVWKAPIRRAPAAEEVNGGGGGGRQFVLAGRSVYYGALLYLGDLTGGLWLSVFMQSAAVLLALVLTLQPFDMLEWRSIGVGAAALAALTPVAFFTSLLVPDVFAGVAILAAANLIAYSGGMSRAVWLTWIGLLSAALLFHASHLAVVAGLLAVFAFAWMFRRPVTRAGIGAVLLAVVVSLAGEVAFLRGVEKISGVTPTRPPFLMARVIADGPGTAYLKANCPRAGFVVCRFVDRFPVGHSDEFLWSTDPARGGTFMALDADTRRALSSEELPFVLAVLAFDPVGQIRASLSNTLQLLGSFALREFSYVVGSGKKFSDDKVPHPYFDVMATTKAWTGSLPTQRMSIVIMVFAILSLAYLVVGTLVRPRPSDRDSRWTVFCAVIFLGLLGNAFVCGALSAPRDRYQARVVWLLPLTAFLLYGRRRQDAAQLTFTTSNDAQPASPGKA